MNKAPAVSVNPELDKAVLEAKMDSMDRKLDVIIRLLKTTTTK